MDFKILNFFKKINNLLNFLIIKNIHPLVFKKI